MNTNRKISKSLAPLFSIFLFTFPISINAEMKPNWLPVQAKGFTGSAPSFNTYKDQKRVKKKGTKKLASKDCQNKKNQNSIAGAAIGGFLGNRFGGRRKGFATAAGAATGAVVAGANTDC